MYQPLVRGLLASAFILTFAVFISVPSAAYAALSQDQAVAVAGLLRSFGADESMITSIQGQVLGVAVPDDYTNVTGDQYPAYCPTLSSTLQLGSRGTQVTELQHFLSGRYNIAPSEIMTGYFGTITRGYVQEFQREQGLPSYGTVGPLTRAAIKAECGGASAPTGGTTPTTSAVPILTITPGVQPANSLAPQGVLNLAFTRFTVSNPSANPVNFAGGFTVEITGVPNAVLKSVRLLDSAGNPIGSLYNVFANPTHNWVGLNLDTTFAPGETKTFMVVADTADNLSAYAGSFVKLTVIGFNSGTGVVGPFPITGATHTINTTLTACPDPQHIYGYQCPGSTTTSTGPVTIANSPNVPAQNIAANVPNQPLGGFTVTTPNSGLSVTGMTFMVATGTAPSGLLTNVTLVDQSGSVVAGPVNAYLQNGVELIRFTEQVVLSPGAGQTRTFTVRGKVPASTQNNATIALVTSPAATWLNPRDTAKGDPVSLASVASFTMNTMTVKKAAFTVSMSGPAGTTVPAGGYATLWKETLDASGSGEDVRIGGVPVFLTGNGSTSYGGDLTNCKVFNASGVPLTTGTHVVNGFPVIGQQNFVFDSPLVVPKGTVTTIYMACQITATGAVGHVYTFSTVSGTGDYLATGATSGTAVLPLVWAGQAGPYTVTAGTSTSSFKSYPTVTLGSLPSTGLEDGRLMRFMITANSTGSIGIGQLVFIISNGSIATNSQADLYAFTDPNYSQPVGGFFAGGGINGGPISGNGGAAIIKFPQPLQIAPGSVMYFELRDSSKGSGIIFTGNVVTTLMGDNENVGLGPFMSKNFMWSPNSTTTSSFATNDWTNGYGVVGLPPSGLSQTRTGSGTGTVPPVATLAVSPSTIAQGGSATLSWVTSGVSGCQTSTFSFGGQTSGSTSVSPSTTTTYMMTCTSLSGATITASATLTVTPPPTSAPTCSLGFSPSTTLPYPQGTATLTWASTNATAGSINWPGSAGPMSVGANGSLNSTFLPQNTTTYTGTFTGPNGTATCSATLNVTNVAPSVPVVTVPTKAYPNTVYTISFNSTDLNGDQVRYGIDDGINDVHWWSPSPGYSPSGTTYVANGWIWATTGSRTYKVLSEDSKGARSAWGSFTVNVINPPTGGGGGGGVQP